MNVIICDDQKDELEHMKQIVSEYADAHSELFIKIKCFSNPFDLLDDINVSGAPDIALLDICMPGILGTEIVREIRNRGEDSTDIIFLTTSSDFAVEAFALHVNDYLTKPYTKERLTDTLDRVIEKRHKRLCVPITSGKDIHLIDLYQVMYIESRNHNAHIYLKSGKNMKTHTTLTELKNLFLDVSGFMTVGASYIVNLRYVQSVLQTTILMENGESIPVPRRLRSELRKQYFDFYIKEATEK